MIFVKPLVSCPIECIRLLVCVLPPCPTRGSRTDFGELRVRALQRADCPHAPASGLFARSGNRLVLSPHASSSPASSCKRIAPASRPPQAAAATASGTVACSSSSGLVACSGSLRCPLQSLTVRAKTAPTAASWRSWVLILVLANRLSLASEGISINKEWGNWFMIPNILVQFQQTRAPLAEWSREKHRATLEPVWAILAYAKAGVRRSNTQNHQKSGPWKTACSILPSGPHHLWGAGKHVVK